METIIADWENIKANINDKKEFEIFIPAFVKLTVAEYIDARIKNKQDEKDGQ